MKTIIWLSVALALTISCSNRTSPAQVALARNALARDTSVVITMERTFCFGRCPAYSLRIHGNGLVQYTGKGWVAVSGERTSQIPLDSVWALLEAFRSIGYFAFKDEYRTDEKGMTITDLPSAITSLSVDGRTKRVVDYYSTPESLRLLEERIDLVTNSEQWTGAKERSHRLDSLKTLRGRDGR